MKFNIPKSCINKKLPNIQTYAITLGITMLTVAGLFLFENNVNNVIAQSETISMNNTLATSDAQQQQCSPQLNLIIQEQGKIINQRVLEVHPHPKNRINICC